MLEHMNIGLLNN